MRGVERISDRCFQLMTGTDEDVGLLGKVNPLIKMASAVILFIVADILNDPMSLTAYLVVLVE